MAKKLYKIIGAYAGFAIGTTIEADSDSVEASGMLGIKMEEVPTGEEASAGSEKTDVETGSDDPTKVNPSEGPKPPPPAPPTPPKPPVAPIKAAVVPVPPSGPSA